MAQETVITTADEWVSFPGGELEGRRPKTLCPACRAAVKREDPARTLCFQCYRAGLERERALAAAGRLDTASDARFQSQLPFEQIDTGRLAVLKAQRSEVRGLVLQGTARFEDRRRRAQIAARHALQEIVRGVAARQLTRSDRDRALASAMHAAELQLPESWLPFVMFQRKAVSR